MEEIQNAIDLIKSLKCLLNSGIITDFEYKLFADRLIEKYPIAKLNRGIYAITR